MLLVTVDKDTKLKLNYNFSVNIIALDMLILNGGYDTVIIPYPLLKLSYTD